MLNRLKPTKGESLLIWRRRLCFNQVQAAAEFGVHPDHYRGWEADKRLENQPKPSLGPLMPHETCYLLRRRAGKQQKDIAREMGISRLWLLKMESGTVPVERLVEYWEAKQLCQR